MKKLLVVGVAFLIVGCVPRVPMPRMVPIPKPPPIPKVVPIPKPVPPARPMVLPKAPNPVEMRKPFTEGGIPQPARRSPDASPKAVEPGVHVPHIHIPHGADTAKKDRDD